MTGSSAPPPARVIHVLQGDFAVSSDPAVMLTAVLGSCVSACLHDPNAGVGGMNHFLLPDGGPERRDARLYGVHLMELLINELLRQGARKDRLIAKLFGGGRVVAGLTDIGAGNAAFARRFMKDEGIWCAAESLGGDFGRRVRYWPATGVARALQLSSIEPSPPPRPARNLEVSDGEVELF